MTTRCVTPTPSNGKAKPCVIRVLGVGGVEVGIGGMVSAPDVCRPWSLSDVLSLPVLATCGRQGAFTPVPPMTPGTTTPPLEEQGFVAPPPWSLSPPLWIDVETGEQPEVVSRLGQAAGLHPLTVEDCLNPDSREKTESYEQYVFVVITEAGFIPGTNWMRSANLCVAAFNNLVLTIHHGRSEAVNHVSGMLTMMAHEQGRRGTRPPSGRDSAPTPPTGWVLYALADRVVDVHIVLVDQVLAESEAVERLVLLLSPGEQGSTLNRLASARRRVADMEGKLLAKKTVVRTLFKSGAEDPLLGPKITFYLRDVLDHVLRCVEKLSIAEAMVTSCTETYLAKVSIAVTEASNNANLLTKAFGAVATLFLPLSIVTSLFGVNIRVPGREDHTLWPFIELCIAMILYTVVGWCFFVRAGWL